MVGRLLKEGANPNLIGPTAQREPHIDYGELPLDIVMNEEHHMKDLAVEGLSFVRKYNIKTDVDYDICRRLLIQFNAKPREVVKTT